jgi:hypothetical protein
MGGRTPVRAVALLWAAWFGLFGLFAHGYIENTDTEITIQAARAWYLRGGPGLVRADQTALLADGAPTWPAEHLVASLISDPALPRYGRTGVDGKHYVWFPLGYQALLVPCVAIGDVLARIWPAPERAYLAERGPVRGDLFWAGLVASFLSPLAAAGIVVVLLLLARTLGATPREALGVVAVAALSTQFLPGSSETLSNLPGAFFLCATVLCIARYAAGVAGARALWWAGMLAGSGVLVRYPQLVPLAAIGGWAAWAAWRRRRVVDLAWFALGGAPWAVLFLWANHARFGTIVETGYSSGAGFGSFPVWIGAFAILLAPGKGVLWFSPPLWLVFAQYVRRTAWTSATASMLVAFVLPLLLFAGVPYWAAGQCWSIRYLTAEIVLLVVVVFVRTRPWQRWPRLCGALAALGLAVSLGGVLTPYTGHQQLAFRAGERIYGPVENLDNNVNFDLRLTPLHTHWIYAWLSARGRLSADEPRDVLGDLFGVDGGPVRLASRTETGFRHWWLRSLPLRWPEFPALQVALAWLAATLAAFWFGARAWLGRRDAPGRTEAD